MMDFDAQQLLCCEEMMSSPDDDDHDEAFACIISTSFECQELEQSFFHDSLKSSSYEGVMPGPASAAGLYMEDALTVQLLLEKQLHCLPPNTYLDALQSTPMCVERRRAVRWLLKAHSIFNFSPSTATLAVNYLDQFLAQNLSLLWKTWMLDLLSVACLSIAAKMEEVEVPALLDLQIDGLEHSFHGATVQRMELALLNSLDWKLRSVTCFTFAEKAIGYLDVGGHHVRNLLLDRVAELLLGTLTEVDFLGFEPSVVAVSSICFALEESVPIQAHTLKAWLLSYIPSVEESVSRCCRALEELVVDPDSPKSESPTSPMGVLSHQYAPLCTPTSFPPVSSTAPAKLTSLIVVHGGGGGSDEHLGLATSDGDHCVLHCDHCATRSTYNNENNNLCPRSTCVPRMRCCADEVQLLHATFLHTNKEHANNPSPKRQCRF